MANTTVYDGHFITVTLVDADWSMEDDVGFKIAKVKNIQFNSTNADDVIVVHDGGLDNAEIARLFIVTAKQAQNKDFGDGVWCRPVVDISDCTVVGTCIMTIEIA